MDDIIIGITYYKGTTVNRRTLLNNGPFETQLTIVIVGPSYFAKGLQETFTK